MRVVEPSNRGPLKGATEFAEASPPRAPSADSAFSLKNSFDNQSQTSQVGESDLFNNHCCGESFRNSGQSHSRIVGSTRGGLFAGGSRGQLLPGVNRNDSTSHGCWPRLRHRGLVMGHEGTQEQQAPEWLPQLVLSILVKWKIPILVRG